MTNWEVVVVGAGPAGSVAAERLARQGVSVLLVERRPFPRWKLCGGCLGPAAMAWLESAGLDHVVSENRGVPLTELELVGPRGTADIRLRGNVALSRSALDRALAAAAVSAGAEFRDGVRAGLVACDAEAMTVELTESGGGAAPEVVRARVVLDASGLAGGLTRSGTGPAPDMASVSIDSRSRIGVGAVLDAPEYPLVPGRLRMVVGRAGYVGLVRVEDGSLNVAAAVDPALVAERGAEGCVRVILTEAGVPLPTGACRTGWKGTPPLTRTPRAIAGPRLFRIGDAAGYIEPFTGEGMGWAIGTGVSVTGFVQSALEGWNDALAEAWTSHYRRRIARGQRTCSMVAGALRRPWLVDAAIACAGRVPALAAPVVRATARVPALRGLRAAASPRVVTVR